MSDDEKLGRLLGTLFQAHPWHGIDPGDARVAVNAYIEISPADAIKYELDKPTGHLRIDRPQRYSSLSPVAYGFIPRTYCGALVGQRCAERLGIASIAGDGDPMDICVLTEKGFAHGDFLCRARPIGGLRMVDGDQADDKIVAVLEGDLAYGGLQELDEVPKPIVERLRHYFLTYKQLPQEAPRKVSIAEIYDRAEAAEVIARSVQDYRTEYGAPEDRLGALRALLRGGRA